MEAQDNAVNGPNSGPPYDPFAILKARYDPEWNDPVLDAAYNLVDEAGVREEEEMRHIRAIEILLLHRDLNAAVAFEEKGMKVSDTLAEKTSLPTLLSDLVFFRSALVGELTSDKDDRISFTDYKTVRNAIIRFCREIRAYQRATGIDRSREDFTLVRPFAVLQAEIYASYVSSEPDSLGSFLDGYFA